MTDGLISWQPRNTASSAQLRVTQSTGCYPNWTMRSRNLYRQHVTPQTDLTDHLVVWTERQPKPNTNLCHLALEAETASAGHTHDLRQDLDNRAGHIKLIYGSRGHSPAREDGHQAWHDKHNLTRAENCIRTSSELRRDVAQYRGAAHPLCFTDEVMDHQIPEVLNP